MKYEIVYELVFYYGYPVTTSFGEVLRLSCYFENLYKKQDDFCKEFIF